MALRRAGVGIRAERNVERILYADDAGIVSKSTERRAKTMKVIVTVLEAGRQAGLTMLDQKTDTMLLQTRDHASRAPPFFIEATENRAINRPISVYTSAALSMRKLTSWARWIGGSE